MAAHHRQLDDVGGGSLDHRVDGQPLAQRAPLALLGAQLGDRPAAAHQGGHEPVALGARDRLVDEPLHRREALEVALDVDRRLLAGDLEAIGEPEGGEAVGDPEVDHLRLRALGRARPRRARC